MKLTLQNKKEEAGIVTLEFMPEGTLAWQAGQYLHYVLPHEADGRGSERWFTVAAASSEGLVRIVTRRAPERASSFKRKLFALEAGQTIEADGPEGDFVAGDPAQKYLFVAGGIGITPFYAILKEADTQGVKLDAVLVYGTRDEHPVFKDELAAMARRNPALKVRYVAAPAMLDEASIAAAAPDFAQRAVYLSGPEPMVKAMAPKVAAMGVPEAQIKLDDFPGYEQY